jgi:crotonobetaine/carnitine-CoA ligase
MAGVLAPDRPQSISTLLRERAEASADDLFVRFVDEDVSFSQMLERAEAAARALAAAGIGRGDRLALMLPNCLEFLELWFGASLLGAVLVPVNTALRGEGLRYPLEHAKPSLLVIDAPLADVVAEALGPSSPPILVRRESSTGEQDDLGSTLAGAHPEVSLWEAAPDELASILYTSGTTGPPKGVMNCHNAYVTAGREFAVETVRARADDVLYTSLPLFHINAQSLTTMGSLISGRPMVLSPRFSASRFFDEIRENGATVFNYIGAMLTMLWKQPERDTDAANPVRLAVGGAAPAELWPSFEQRFGCTILEIYGLTESACFCLSSPPEKIRVGRVGTPVSWSEVRIEGPDGDEAEPGTAGEICIRSKLPEVMFQGYFANPTATEEAWRGGWFHSGDRGEVDADGYVAFVDRLKDSIRRRGENISSYEVERAVNSHPAVAESAAVAVPSELGEDEVMIVVVPVPGEELEPADLIEFCGTRVASFMVPRFVRIVPELPKTGTERVRKFVLREQGADGAWDREAPAAD